MVFFKGGLIREHYSYFIRSLQKVNETMYVKPSVWCLAYSQCPKKIKNLPLNPTSQVSEMPFGRFVSSERRASTTCLGMKVSKFSLGNTQATKLQAHVIWPPFVHAILNEQILCPLEHCCALCFWWATADAKREQSNPAVCVSPLNLVLGLAMGVLQPILHLILATAGVTFPTLL